MRTALYWLIQCTWGLPQTLLGLVLLLLHRRDEHFLHHGAVITRWQGRASMSVGPFVFITSNPFFCEKLSDRFSREELADRLLVHEYGHTIQSLLLGPAYLIVIGIPSTLWGWLPSLNRMRREQQRSYFSFFTESWANRCGEWVTGRKSMEQLVID
ncbi:MAG: hypothetical protein E7327_05910 [Clostridiales bacterium]|nr:hypothetical protein [Clostridiales bacterium]